MKITEKASRWEPLTLALNLMIVVSVNFILCQVPLDLYGLCGSRRMQAAIIYHL